MNTKETFREIFKLAVRLLGLLLLYHGVQSFALRPNLDGAVSSIIYLGVAYWLFRGAFPVLRWAYPEAAAAETTSHELGAASESKADA
jgi:hypothetical protein